MRCRWRFAINAQDCLFCKIVSGELPAQIVWKDGFVTAFRDINPKAPVHILVIPNRHLEGLGDLAAQEAELAAKLVSTAAALAEREGVAASGYRVVANTGPAAGQSVPHLHLHVLGGRRLAWPPG